MRVSPLELQQKRFSRGFWGLNENEVYSFLDMAREEFEDLLRDNFSLKEKVQRLEADIHETREVDTMIWNFISHAAAIKQEKGK